MAYIFSSVIILQGKLQCNIYKNVNAVVMFYIIVWADNADAMSKQYAGTGALKTDITR